LLPADDDARERLRVFGLTRIGEFADLARSAVIARFGEHGGMLHDLARGMDGRALRPRKPIEQLRAEAELDPPVDNVEPLRFVLRNLCGALCEQLTARGAGATRATLILDVERGEPVRLEQALPEPAAVPELLERLLVARLATSLPAAAVTRLTLELRPRRTAGLAADRTGIALRCGPAASRPPGRSRGDPARAARDVVRGHCRTDVQRPNRSMTRLLGHHPKISVELDGEGHPQALRWDGGSEAVEVCNQWRIEEAWWRRPVSRDYYKLAGTRLLALVYRDRVDGTWHLERVYD
jgi:hypothetical protein